MSKPGGGSLKKKCLMVVNDAGFFLTHRLPVALAAQEAGYEVHIVTGPSEACSRIVEAGLPHHEIPLSRSGKNPFRELAAILSLIRLFRRLSPDVVHLVTIKPVLYGGIAARIARVPAVVAAISGLGSVFVAEGFVARCFRAMVQALYRAALRHSNLRVIFQNGTDREVLENLDLIPAGCAVMIRGSGVDLTRFQVVPEPEGDLVAIFAARLIRDKGVCEFVEAARLLRDSGFHARFQIAGDIDPDNPSSLTTEEVEAWQTEGVIEWLGYQTNMADCFSKVNLVVFPSYYGEGLPKVLIEAAACGRAVVTTDWPGCRDAVIPDESGLMVPVREVEALADAMRRVLADSVLRTEMGCAGRSLAEREYAIEKVAAAHLAVYKEVVD